MTEAQIILVFALGALFGACAALAWVNWELRRKLEQRRQAIKVVAQRRVAEAWGSYLKNTGRSP